VKVIDDFAHHPTAVRETIAAVAARNPGRRLIAVFEPRSNTSRRSLHQAEYARSFGDASMALLSTPLPSDQVPVEERLDVAGLAEQIAESGTPARAFPGPDEIVEALRQEAMPGDVILAMSNGAFGGFVGKLIAALEAR
jgi:UDP-N-acetylmuramate: L-alanyl-gamma-D-glutamyl-meso-diaminopimelate ligase